MTRHATRSGAQVTEQMRCSKEYAMDDMSVSCNAAATCISAADNLTGGPAVTGAMTSGG